LSAAPEAPVYIGAERLRSHLFRDTSCSRDVMIAESDNGPKLSPRAAAFHPRGSGRSGCWDFAHKRLVDL